MIQTRVPKEAPLRVRAPSVQQLVLLGAIVALGNGCERAAQNAEDPENDLAERYVGVVLARDRAIEARQYKEADRLWKELRALAPRLASAGDEQFDRFITTFEGLPAARRRRFYDQWRWPFNNRRGLQYLAARLEGQSDREKVQIAELLAVRRFWAAKKAITKLYEAARDGGALDEQNALAQALVRLGEARPLLDLVEQIETKKGGPSQWAAQFLDGLDRRWIRVCVGPLVRLYQGTARDHPSHGIQAARLASAVNLGPNPFSTEARAVRLVDEWLKTEAARQAIFGSYASLGDLARKHGQWHRALRHLDKALAFKPKDRDVRLNRAVCMGMLGERQKAVGVVTRLLAEEPEHWRAWRVRGMLNLELERYEQAAADMKKALGFKQNDVITLRLLRSAYSGMGAQEKAKEVEQRLRLATQKSQD